jgi:surface antigen
MSHGKTWQEVQQINGLANPNFIFPGQSLCLARNTVSTAIKGTGNYFSYPQCTWGANQKYHALHGIWVPWTQNSNAYQWADRARDFHWTVSSTPQVGDIFVLAPWRQGAYGLGHVGVVLSVGAKTFEGTSTNWFPHFFQFTNITYTTAGVQFLRY